MAKIKVLHVGTDIEELRGKKGLKKITVYGVRLVLGVFDVFVEETNDKKHFVHGMCELRDEKLDIKDKEDFYGTHYRHFWHNNERVSVQYTECKKHSIFIKKQTCEQGFIEPNTFIRLKALYEEFGLDKEALHLAVVRQMNATYKPANDISCSYFIEPLQSTLSRLAQRTNQRIAARVATNG